MRCPRCDEKVKPTARGRVPKGHKCDLGAIQAKELREADARREARERGANGG